MWRGIAAMVALGPALCGCQLVFGYQQESRDAAPGPRDTNANADAAADTAIPTDTRTLADSADTAPLADTTPLADRGEPPQIPRFGQPTLVPVVNSPTTYDDGPHLSADGLRLYFSSDRSGGYGGRDIYLATRPTVKDTFATPKPLGVISTDQDEADATLSADELTIVFERDVGPGDTDLFIATRPTVADPFGEPVALTALNTPGEDEDPGLSPDGRELVFLSDRKGGEEIWRATRPATNLAFGAPARLAEVNSSDADWDPAFAGVHLLVLVSDRPGGVGSTDLYMAVRDHEKAPFGQPQLLEVVSTPALEAEVFYHEGLGLLIFTKKENSGDHQMYWSTAK